MSGRDRQTVLDELLTEILRGDIEVEILLKRYPEYAPELRELLRTALHVQKVLMDACPEAENETWGRVQAAVREKLLAAMETSG